MKYEHFRETVEFFMLNLKRVVYMYAMKQSEYKIDIINTRQTHRSTT